MYVTEPRKPYTRILARYLEQLRYEDIPDPVVSRAKQVILHTIGASLACFHSKMAQDSIALAKDMGTGGINASILGDGSLVSLQNAAFANGVLADLLDWEDCSWTGHPSAGLVPTGIAVSQAYRKSGKELLTAIVGGFEVYQRIAMAINPSLERFLSGWGLHCWQIFASATVAGKLMGFKGEKMQQLFGAAAVMTPNALDYLHASFSDFYHYTWGLTAKNAIECAWITERGITTLTEALEGSSGYYVGTSDQCDWSWFDKELGQRYLIMELMIKNWPVNMWIQSPMDLLDGLYKKHRFDPDDIERIEVSPYIPRRSEPTPKEGYASLVKAQFSIPFCLAMYLKGPAMGVAWLDEKYLTDPEILQLASRVVGIGETDVSHYHHFVSFQNGGYLTYQMKIIMKDGSHYQESLDYPKGHPSNPFTDQECIDNFHLQTRDVLAEDRRDALVDFVFNRLESVQDMTEMIPYTTIGAGRG
jgi:2-methylcitrate dehydratase PrpD